MQRQRMCLAIAADTDRVYQEIPKKGFTLELEAAQKGIAEAQFSVGVCFSRGEGVRRDLEQAFSWYLKAAKKGHTDAAYNVGYFFRVVAAEAKALRKQATGTPAPKS